MVNQVDFGDETEEAAIVDHDNDSISSQDRYHILNLVARRNHFKFAGHVVADCGFEVLLVVIKRQKAESTELLANIHGWGGNTDLEGLLGLVTRALQLHPDREDLQKSKGYLQEHEHMVRSQKLTNSIGMKFSSISAGEFLMGSPVKEIQRCNDETQHRVELTKSFYLGVTQVTQDQYERVMGKNPSANKSPQNPVENVCWEDAVVFCRELSALPAEKAVGINYRLPTEAEWEYACRAGTTTAWMFGDLSDHLCDYCWFNENRNYEGTARPVGGKKPNAWGLDDMHGNVNEWCQDWYGEYPSGSVTDPTGPTSGSGRVTRGGSWFEDCWTCRSACRRGGTNPESWYNSVGFRVLHSSIK